MPAVPPAGEGSADPADHADPTAPTAPAGPAGLAAQAGPVRPAPGAAWRRRRRPGPGWAPDQPGAWAVLLVPVVVGAVVSGPRPLHALLLATWLVGYLTFRAAALWLRSGRRPRWWPPVRAYGVGAVVLGLALVALAPGLVWWVVPFVWLAAASLRLSARRRDRSVADDLVVAVAACLVTVVAHQVGVGATDLDLGRRLHADPEAWTAAAVLLAWLGGTVLYVTTTRDRGSRPVYVASVAWHAVAGTAAAWLTGSPLVAGVAALLLVRAVVVPRVRPGAPPVVVDVGEVVASVLVTVGVVVALG